jgi:uncharacterized membrane protein YhaH (DUF805 family)
MHWVIAPFKKYADFSGRARRIEFWSFAALFVILSLVANYLDAMDGVRTPIAARMGVVELTTSLLLLLPFLSVGARRLHDTGRAGWWMMLVYFPYLAWIAARDNVAAQQVSLGAIALGFVALFILLILPGEETENRFGPNPRVMSA